VKFEFLNKSNQFSPVQQLGDEKDLAAFFSGLTLLILMVVTMTATPTGF
jgi:hypothetical protein